MSPMAALRTKQIFGFYQPMSAFLATPRVHMAIKAGSLFVEWGASSLIRLNFFVVMLHGKRLSSGMADHENLSPFWTVY